MFIFLLLIFFLGAGPILLFLIQGKHMLVDKLILSDKTQNYNVTYGRSVPIHVPSHTEDHPKCW